MYSDRYSAFEWQALLYEWGPRVLGAVLIMLAAWLIGWAVKWALAKLVDRTPIASRHNQTQGQGPTLGAQLGNLANWLILLIGLIAALGALGLQYIVDPLNGLVAQFLSFLPNLIGAGLIFFIGYIVATLAKRIVESALNVAHVDRALERAGVSRMTGAQGLSKTAGTVVFVLIIIPIAIAALEQLGIRAISEPAVSVLQTVLDALPRVIAAAVVLAIAYFIARWVASLIEQILPSLGLDRSLSALGLGGGAGSTPTGDTLSQSGATATPSPTSSLTPSKIIAQVVLWAIMLFAATQAAALLGFQPIAVMLQQVLELFGRVIFGGVIILVGVLLANFLAGLAGRSGGTSAQLASTLIRWATIALVTAMGLTFMGIAEEIVILAFGLILGSAAVAAAVAFGIGGREPAKRLLERAQARAEQQSATPTPPPTAGSTMPPSPPDSPLVG